MSHTYTYDGVEYPSVTTILSTLAKPALIEWAARETAKAAVEEHNESLASLTQKPWDDIDTKRLAGTHRRLSRIAANRGTDVHKLAEQLLSTEGALESESPYVIGLRQWLEATKPKFLLTERIVINPSIGYAGRFDALVEIAGRRFLLDYKTRNSVDKAQTVYVENRLQLAAYSWAPCCLTADNRLEESWPRANIPSGLVINLYPGGYVSHEVALDQKAYVAFCSLMHVHNFVRENS